MDITGKRGVDAIIEMDLTANAKLIPGVLRPKGSVIIYGTGPEAVVPAAFCLVNSIRLQFFLVYELDAAERERAVSAINDRARERPVTQSGRTPDLCLGRHRGSARGGRARHARQCHCNE